MEKYAEDDFDEESEAKYDASMDRIAKENADRQKMRDDELRKLTVHRLALPAICAVGFSHDAAWALIAKIETGGIPGLAFVYGDEK